jgi:hypothetical protein
MRGEVSRPSSTSNRISLRLKSWVGLAHPPYINSEERLRPLNDGVATLESEVEAQKRETEGSWMAKIQPVEELNRLIRVTDALLLSMHAVGADITKCERERQTARADHARFDRERSNLTKLDHCHRSSTEY